MKARVEVLYFGSIRDITGTGSDFAEVNSLEDLNKQLIFKHPGLGTATFRYAVNRKLASGNPPLQTGDTVALLPPFAGG